MFFLQINLFLFIFQDCYVGVGLWILWYIFKYEIIDVALFKVSPGNLEKKNQHFYK